MARSAMSTRSGLFFLFTVLVAIAVVPAAGASDEGAVDGTYGVTLTATKECKQGDVTEHAGVTVRLEATVTQHGSAVRFTLEGRPFTGSIDSGLNFDLPVLENRWIGHFTLLSDGGSTISGQVVGECEGSGTGPWMQISGGRTGGGPVPTVTPTPDLNEEIQSLPGFSAAGDLIAQHCPSDTQSTACEAAFQESQDWFRAMGKDKNSLKPRPSPEIGDALTELVIIVTQAARLGSLRYSEPAPAGSCAPSHALFPLVNSMLPVFAKLFIQGINSAGNDQLEGVTRARDLADALLAVAVNGSLHPRIGLETTCGG